MEIPDCCVIIFHEIVHLVSDGGPLTVIMVMLSRAAVSHTLLLTPACGLVGPVSANVWLLSVSQVVNILFPSPLIGGKFGTSFPV